MHDGVYSNTLPCRTAGRSSFQQTAPHSQADTRAIPSSLRQVTSQVAVWAVRPSYRSPPSE